MCGCAPAPTIKSYVVERDAPDRLLGAIVLQDERGWFFKLTVPAAEVGAKEAEFREFLASLKISASGPVWKLPAGWEEDDRPREMRFATINVPLKSKHAELTISVLPREGSGLLPNINRWREQLDQPKVSVLDPRSLEQVETGSGTAFVVKLAGRMKASGMAPFAGR